MRACTGLGLWKEKEGECRCSDYVCVCVSLSLCDPPLLVIVAVNFSRKVPFVGVIGMSPRALEARQTEIAVQLNIYIFVQKQCWSDALLC